MESHWKSVELLKLQIHIYIVGFVLGVLVLWILGGFSGGESGHLDLISLEEIFFLFQDLFLMFIMKSLPLIRGREEQIVQH